MENKTIVNENGFVVDYGVTFINDIAIDFEMEDKMYSVEFYTGGFVKPRWNGSTWVEGATEEEIQAWQEENKTKENIQVTEEQQLLSTVLLENAEIKEQLKEQQELSSNLMLQIAELREEKANV